MKKLSKININIITSIVTIFILSITFYTVHAESNEEYSPVTSYVFKVINVNDNGDITIKKDGFSLISIDNEEIPYNETYKEGDKIKIWVPKNDHRHVIEFKKE